MKFLPDPIWVKITNTHCQEANKIKFESEFDFCPRGFILHESFDWEEFISRVKEVSIKRPFYRHRIFKHQFGIWPHLTSFDLCHRFSSLKQPPNIMEAVFCPTQNGWTYFLLPMGTKIFLVGMKFTDFPSLPLNDFWRLHSKMEMANTSTQLRSKILSSEKPLPNMVSLELVFGKCVTFTHVTFMT